MASGETVQQASTDVDEYEAGARVYGDIFSSTLTQYSVVWTRLGTMQSAAGALLTIISLAIAIVIGARPSEQAWAQLSPSVRWIMQGAFLIAMGSFLVAFWCVIPVLWNSVRQSLSTPSELRQKIEEHLESNVPTTAAAPNQVFSLNYLMRRFDNEMKLVEQDIKRKSAWFQGCLVAALISVGMSVFILIIYYRGI